MSRVWRQPGVLAGGVILLVLLVLALAAPLITLRDPLLIDPANRNKRPLTVMTVTPADGRPMEMTAWMGTDSLGRDLFSRVLHGGRVSLLIGATVSLAAVGIGLLIGLMAGYFRKLDGPVMRVMDGLMAIPGILLALALVALWGGGLGTVILAITVPEVPRVVRLIRSVVLSVKEEPFVEAAIASGTATPALLWRHILPSTIPALLVQGSYIAASAILVEAILSFLGAGLPTDIPSWGNIMAEGRTLFRVYPHNILLPGFFLALTVLAVNMAGDGLRDALDPTLQKRTLGR